MGRDDTLEFRFLIKNGDVVDGTGAPPFRADVRIRDGKITQIGANLDREGDERVFDAAGCYVAPGFIDGHNHFDGPMWWTPTMEPMPGYGVTTSVNGNCGFSAAPVSGDLAARKEMVGIFSFFEDIPEKPFLDLLPWDWRKWSEYKTSVQKHVKTPANIASFVGHIAIRLAVMGTEAWDRAATPEEIHKMCEHLDDALSAGALGLSSNLLDHDANDRPIPTWKADDAEWTALMDVIVRHEGATLQVIVDYLQRMKAPESIRRLAELARGRKIRIQIVGGIPQFDIFADLIPEAWATKEKLQAEGLDFWMGFHHRSPTITINFNTSLIWAQANNYAWGEIIQAESVPAKSALLRDPEWRARGRKGWDETFDRLPQKKPENLTFFQSESGAGPLGLTLKEYMDRTGATHPSDALADWVLDNGPASMLLVASPPNDEASTMALLRDPMAVGNLTDAGAHGQLICGVGENVELLTDYVRDKGKLRIEEAVRVLAGRPAEHFNLHDRGTLEVGKRADVVVFNLDEIELRPMKKAWDVPDCEGGRTFRWSRDPAPMRLTLVNGVPTFDNGDFTGRYPGEFIGPTARA